MKMLLVRQGKDVRDSKGALLGSSGALLPMDAPIRASDRTKVIEVDVEPQAEEEEAL